MTDHAREAIAEASRCFAPEGLHFTHERKLREIFQRAIDSAVAEAVRERDALKARVEELEKDRNKLMAKFISQRDKHEELDSRVYNLLVLMTGKYGPTVPVKITEKTGWINALEEEVRLLKARAESLRALLGEATDTLRWYADSANRDEDAFYYFEIINGRRVTDQGDRAEATLRHIETKLKEQGHE